MYLFSILAPPSLIILSSVYPFSLLARPLFILSLSLFLYMRPVSILTPMSLFLPCTCSPYWLLHLSSFFLQYTHSPSWLPFSLFFFFNLYHCRPCISCIHVPSASLPSSICLSFFSILLLRLAPPPPLFSICLSFFIYNQSPSWLPCLFLPRARSPSWLPRVPSVSRSPSLTHSSECDRQVLVTVEASSRARLLFGSAVPDLQPACPTF